MEYCLQHYISHKIRQEYNMTNCHVGYSNTYVWDTHKPSIKNTKWTKIFEWA